jgi:DNA modification methylase
MTEVFAQHVSESFAAYNVDTVEFTAEMPSNSIDFSVYSPPFSSLYIYSESERDMGNVDGDEAFQGCYRPLLEQLWRVTKPGRLTAIHVKDLVYYSNASEDGSRGLRDFPGDCITSHRVAGAEAARKANQRGGWAYHGKTTIWRDPVREMQKAKPDGLLYKNFRTDAARCRPGLPEYLIWFRKWGDGMEDTPPVLHDPNVFPVEIWQQWASPVWTDTRETDVLNVKVARDDEAEKHLCPMPLDLTERAVWLHSNPGDVVYSPFMGIGSEGWASLKAGRRFVGTELKDTYYRQAVKNLREAEEIARTPSLLATTGAAA